jgi:hypothetical protein
LEAGTEVNAGNMTVSLAVGPVRERKLGSLCDPTKHEEVVKESALSSLRIGMYWNSEGTRKEVSSKKEVFRLL